MDLIAIGVIGLAFTIWLSLPSRIRKDRREQMGLDVEVVELDELPTQSSATTITENWAWPPR